MSISIFELKLRCVGLLLCFSAMSCGKSRDQGTVLAPLALEQLSLPELQGSAGIYPSQTTLRDPANPFVHLAVSSEQRWSITSWAMQANAPAARLAALFYVWSTELALAASGESQFQVAAALRALSTHVSLDANRQQTYQLAAIQAYQAVLDNFKDARGYTAEGYPYRLVPLAFYAIRDLGGTPRGRWVETVDPYGNKIVIEN